MKTIIIKSFCFLSICLMFSGCEKKFGEGVNLEGIETGEASLRVNMGESVKAKAYPVPWNCTSYEFTWEVADTSIASVDHYGRITGEDVGNTAVYVSQGNIRKEFKLEVYELTLMDRLTVLDGLVGFWDFEDASNLEKAITGKDFITYFREQDGEIGVPSKEGISPVAGFNKRDHAVKIGHGSLFFCDHGILPAEGEELVGEYTILWDISRPSGEGGFATLLNTNVNNTDDQDVAIRNEGNIGVGTSGYSTNAMARDTWYRVVVVLKASEYYRIYVNGVKWLEGNNYTHDRFKLDPRGTLIMGDEDTDDHTMFLSSVAIFKRAISEDEIKSLGSL